MAALEPLKALQLPQIRDLEQQRGNRLLVLSTAALDFEILPVVYECLRGIGKVPELDLLLFCRGGQVSAARRIALLLREFCGKLNFLIPYYCESAGTLMALAADEILAGPLAIFSPIDPHLQSSTSVPEGAAASLSAEDIRYFREMGEKWFGLSGEPAHGEMLAQLCQKIFPATLSAFYRSTLEMRHIADQLLAYQLPKLAVAERMKIVEHLIHGYHSHQYAITRDEMAKLGLSIRCAAEEESLMWNIMQLAREHTNAQIGYEDGSRPQGVVAASDFTAVLLYQPLAPSSHLNRTTSMVAKWTRIA